jgi:amidophosphoribosyltransferase
LNPCYYGTDVDSKENLIACVHSIDEIAKIVGVDSLAYLNLEDVTKIGQSGNCTGYCTACFDGKYPTETPKAIVNKYENKLSESEK